MLKQLDVDISDAPEVVAACCVLHNFCEIHREDFFEDWLEGVQSEACEHSSASATPAQSQDSAVTIRDTFMSYFTD